MSYTNLIFSRFDFVLLQIVLQETEIMNQGKTVFAQIMSLIPRYEFDKCVKRYNGNRHAIEFKCRDWFMVMSFAQFTDQVSLRSIDATLVALSSKLYSSGIKYIQRPPWPISMRPRIGVYTMISVKFLLLGQENFTKMSLPVLTWTVSCMPLIAALSSCAFSFVHGLVCIMTKAV